MSSKRIGVYQDSDTIRYHLDNLPQPYNTSFTRYISLDEFCRATDDICVAGFHCPYPYDSIIEDKIQKALTKADLVFVTITELHERTVELVQKIDHPKVVYYICGALNFVPQHSKVFPYMDWFQTSTWFYRYYLPELLTRLNPYGDKRCLFDALLGRKKIHRDFIYNYIVQNLPINDFVLNYKHKEDMEIDFNLNDFVWEGTGVKYPTEINWTVEQVQYYGHPISLSQIIPISVYNVSSYSIIAETNCHNHYSFYTEKTSKPIMARRLFIAFSGQYFLRNLRNLGFKTFDGIIDESYDNEANDEVRWQKAAEQVKYLFTQSHPEVMAKIKPIADHNFELLMNRNWHAEFTGHLCQQILSL